MGSFEKRHVVLFPFMAKGHTIPLLQLARFLLLRRRGNTSVTVLTTPANFSFVADFLSGTTAAVVTLLFPANPPGIPAGAESMENLPSTSLLAPFAAATELMRPDFERTLKSLSPRVSFLISDGFLWWTRDSAAELGVPRLVFYGMSCHAMAVQLDLYAAGAFLCGDDGGDARVTAPSFSWFTVTSKDVPAAFKDPSLDSSLSRFTENCVSACARSAGMVVNSFVEIESVFVNHWNRVVGPKAWCVGPLCLGPLISEDGDDDNILESRPSYLRWLDEKAERGRRVLYVAFGSQADISAEQATEIAKGLKESGVDYLWAAGKIPTAEEEYPAEERGFVAREWVDQKRILRHRSVKGFLSHCGWNSVTESLCAAVPILAWPISAEQPLNARNVTEELKIGARVVEADRVKEFVTWQEIAESVQDFMAVDCEAVFKVNVDKLATAAREAVAEGGSSWKALDAMIEETCMCMEKKREKI